MVLPDHVINPKSLPAPALSHRCYRSVYSVVPGLCPESAQSRWLPKTHQQTGKVYIDDFLVDTFTGKGTYTKAYTSGTGKVCIEIIGDGKPCKLRYSYNTLDGKPGTVTIGAENDSNNNYNDSVVVLNWPLVN
ncbi:conserved hypothetical protein [Xenorhabdus nematophila str. Websteri]|nr:conserved hypothetical protein [Xenorhabdus nematophila str. Websteri]CEF32994.1 conserved hypothetical protein [Xenorhabdus nematophila str. Websteri]